MNRSSGEAPFWPPPPGWEPGGGDGGVDQSDLAQDIERGHTETPQQGWAQPDLTPTSFLFGDPRSLRSLGLACVAAIASYPVAWGGLLFIFALGGGAGSGATESERQSGAQSIVWFAAGLVILAVLALVLWWGAARRSYPPDSRESPWSLETGVWAVALLVMLALASVFGVWAWHLDYT